MTGELVSCINCAKTYVHIEEVRVFPVAGKTEYRITHRGLSSSASDAATRQRGASVVLALWCEDCGLRWEVEFQFYKGETFYEERPIERLHQAIGSTLWAS